MNDSGKVETCDYLSTHRAHSQRYVLMSNVKRRFSLFEIMFTQRTVDWLLTTILLSSIGTSALIERDKRVLCHNVRPGVECRSHTIVNRQFHVTEQVNIYSDSMMNLSMHVFTAYETELECSTALQHLKYYFLIKSQWFHCAFATCQRCTSVDCEWCEWFVCTCAFNSFRIHRFVDSMVEVISIIFWIISFNACIHSITHTCTMRPTHNDCSIRRRDYAFQIQILTKRNLHE